MCTLALSMLSGGQAELDDGGSDTVVSSREALGSGSGELRHFIGRVREQNQRVKISGL